MTANDHPELVEVISVGTPEEGHIIVGHLESEGIEATLQYETMGNVLGLSANALGEVQIMVRPEDLEDARAILETDYSEEVLEEFSAEDDDSE